MKVDFTKAFNKQFQKLQPKKQQSARSAIELFLDDPLNPKLRNHPLKAQWNGYVSISAGGDLRLHYKAIDQDSVLFVAVGSHSQLYK